jgi:hypothetical protein
MDRIGASQIRQLRWLVITMDPVGAFRFVSCRIGQNQTSLGVVGPLVSATHTLAEQKSEQEETRPEGNPAVEKEGFQVVANGWGSDIEN